VSRSGSELSATPDQLRESEDLFVHEVGSAIEFWGFKRILGQVWAWLYLEGEARSAAAIAGRLGLSKAAVSTAIAQLEHWGCVSRMRQPGERRELYLAEQDVWRMVSRVFRERELRKVDQSLDVFDRVMRLAKESMSRDLPWRHRARAIHGRVDRLASLARIAKTALVLALDRGRADIRQLRGKR
jgi:HTH-type transcriptional regulator, glycine betaine synthesis regulator